MARVTTFTNPRRRGIPKAIIKWVVTNWIPTSATAEQVRADIVRCVKGPEWTPARIQEAVTYALKLHRERGGRTNPRRRRSVTRNAPRDVPAERNRRRTRTNPASGLRVVGVLSEQALEIKYVHKADGDKYVHKFERGVTIQFLSDGSARFYRPDGRPLWKNFR